MDEFKDDERVGNDIDSSENYKLMTDKNNSIIAVIGTNHKTAYVINGNKLEVHEISDNNMLGDQLNDTLVKINN